MSTTTFDLVAAASAEMIREGFHPDFPDGTEAQVEQIRAALNGATGAATGDGVRVGRKIWSCGVYTGSAAALRVSRFSGIY